MDAPATPPESAATEDPPHALRGLFAAGLETLRTRLDLAATEFEMHLLALAHVLVWARMALAVATHAAQVLRVVRELRIRRASRAR